MNDKQLQSVILHETAHGVFRALTKKNMLDALSFRTCMKIHEDYDSMRLLFKIVEECFCDIFGSLVYKEINTDIMIDFLNNLYDFLPDFIPTKSILKLPITPKAEVDIRRDVLKRASKEIDFDKYQYPFNTEKCMEIFGMLTKMTVHVIQEKVERLKLQDPINLVKADVQEFSKLIHSGLYK